MRSVQMTDLNSRLRALIPFVRIAYAQPTSYEWEDQHGSRHQIWQHEGGEQGDSLLLFCLAVHNPLTALKDQLRPGEYVFAFLDDIYVVSLPERTRAIFNLVAEKLGEGAGVELHAGKTRVWNRACDCPPDMEELGPEVWNAAGIKILVTLVGTAEFEHAVCAARLAEEDKLWKAIKWIPDLQCAWQVLVQCAGPRCHHFSRTMPPSRSAEYAEGHDVGMQQAMNRCWKGCQAAPVSWRWPRRLLHCPCEWEASGSDRCHVWHRRLFGHLGQTRCPCCKIDRLLSVSHQIADVLGGAQALGCLGWLQTATQVLDRNGFVSRPGWRALQVRSTSSPSTRVRAWRVAAWCWQYFASSASEHHFRETVVHAQSCAADQAHLRSHSGAGSSDVLCGCPTGPEFKILPTLFRTIVCGRLRLPLQLTESRCECGVALDKCGRHRGACTAIGKVEVSNDGSRKNIGTHVPRGRSDGVHPRETS